jgi:hypothetical protein
MTLNPIPFEFLLFFSSATTLGRMCSLLRTEEIADYYFLLEVTIIGMLVTILIISVVSVCLKKHTTEGM